MRSLPATLVPKQVEIASANDSDLRLVHQAIITGDWKRLSGTIYKALKDEL